MHIQKSLETNESFNAMILKPYYGTFVHFVLMQIWSTSHIKLHFHKIGENRIDGYSGYHNF